MYRSGVLSFVLYVLRARVIQANRFVGDRNRWLIENEWINDTGSLLVISISVAPSSCRKNGFDSFDLSILLDMSVSLSFFTINRCSRNKTEPNWSAFEYLIIGEMNPRIQSTSFSTKVFHIWRNSVAVTRLTRPVEQFYQKVRFWLAKRVEQTEMIIRRGGDFSFIFPTSKRFEKTDALHLSFHSQREW